MTRISLFSLFSIISAIVCGSFARAVSAVVEAVHIFLEACAPPLELEPVAAPARVAGLHQARSFRGRQIERRGASTRSRAPLSVAFVGS